MKQLIFNTSPVVLYIGIYFGQTDTRLKEIMQTVHDDGHEGVQRTLHRLRRDFHFPNMRKLVQDLVRSCVVCQWHKSEHLHPTGLLLPLPIPQGV